MPTKAKTPLETKRPWRAAGTELRRHLHCPLCTTVKPKTIAYREKTALFECERCGLRFSVPLQASPSREAAHAAGTRMIYRADTIWSGRHDERDPMALMSFFTPDGARKREAEIRDIIEAGGAVVLAYQSHPDDSPAQRAARIAQVEKAKEKARVRIFGLAENQALRDVVGNLEPEMREKFLREHDGRAPRENEA